MELLIKNTRLLNGETTDIAISGNRIISVGDTPAGFAPQRTIDAAGMICMPAAVNAHTHAYMTPLRGCADDMPFEKWLFEGVMPREDKMTPDQAYWGAMQADAEMIRTGTGTFCDMHMFPGASASAAQKCGLRAVMTRGLSGPDGGERRINEHIAECEQFAGCDRITFMLGPHSIYTCDEKYLERIIRLADDLGQGIHIHLSESVSEFENCRREHGCTPTEYLAGLGMFSHRTLAAHCVQLTDTDIELLAANGVSAALCPKSNLKLGNGFAPAKKLLDAGVNLCIGTDSAASNNSLNMFSEMNFTALIHKGVCRDSTAISAREVISFATENGAKALGYNDLGRIEPGYLADIALIDTRAPHMTPCADPASAICYSANGSETDTLIVNGEILMEGGKLLTIDEEELSFNIERITKELG